MVKVWLVYLVITGLIIGIGKFVYNIPIWDFTKEPNAILKCYFYTGAISNHCIILWTVAATLCIFCSIFLQRYNFNSPFRLFLLHVGILTVGLLLDDCYMRHEEMFPVYLGVNQNHVYAVYFIYTFFILIKFRKAIFKTDYIIFFSALLLLALSVLVDVICEKKIITAEVIHLNSKQFDQLEILFEDTFKGLGILTWLIYFSRVTFVNVLPSVINSKEENLS